MLGKLHFRRAPVPEEQTCRCFACGGDFVASTRAVSARCPHCGRSVALQDIVITGPRWMGTVQTCGRVIVERKGKLVASLVETGAGVAVLGAIEARVVSQGFVLLGAKGKWKGDCRAVTILMEPGAQVDGGKFEIAGGIPMELGE